MTTNIACLLVVAAREERVREKRVDCATHFAVDGGNFGHERLGPRHTKYTTNVQHLWLMNR